MMDTAPPSLCLSWYIAIWFSPSLSLCHFLSSFSSRCTCFHCLFLECQTASPSLLHSPSLYLCLVLSFHFVPSLSLFPLYRSLLFCLPLCLSSSFSFSILGSSPVYAAIFWLKNRFWLVGLLTWSILTCVHSDFQTFWLKWWIHPNRPLSHPNNKKVWFCVKYSWQL